MVGTKIMLNQDDIENLIISFISKKHLEKTDEIVKKCIEIEKEKTKIEIAYEKFGKFEEKHLNELQAIWKIPEWRENGHDILSSYLFGAYNSLSNHYRCLEMDKEQILSHKFCPEDFVCIFFEDFEKDLGISKQTAKKYIGILEQKGKIIKKRGMPGLIFKVVEN